MAASIAARRRALTERRLYELPLAVLNTRFGEVDSGT